jgi:hypothetical protein
MTVEETIRYANEQADMVDRYYLSGIDEGNEFLSKDEAMKAIELGIEIGVEGKTEGYHGSNAGRRSFDAIRTVAELERHYNLWEGQIREPYGGAPYSTLYDRAPEISPKYERAGISMKELKKIIGEEIKNSYEKEAAGVQAGVKEYKRLEQFKARSNNAEGEIKMTM